MYEKKMGELIKENESLKKTLRYMSHELLNVLTIVDYSAKKVDKCGKTRESKQLVEDIDYMIKLMRDLSEYNHADDLNLELCCASAIVKSVVDDYKDKNKDINIRLNILETEDAFIARLDKNKIRQIIINIMKNAVEAVSNEKMKMIVITMKKIKRNIVIEISDNGCGIEKRYINDIFKEGFTKNKKDGSGLGLAISKRIVEKHRGKINVKSYPKEGTIFEIELPAI